MKKKHLYIEALRVLACLAVIFNHAPRSSYFLFATREPGSALYFFDLAFSVGCKFAVPVFLAVSGALILHRETTLRELWSKRILRTALMLGVFSLVSCLIGVAAGDKTFEIKAFILKAYDSYHNYSYWYLYSYIAFLVTSPMLGKMLRSLTDREILYLLGVSLFFKTALPAFEQLHWKGVHSLSGYMRPEWLTADILLYPAMGYFMHHRMDLRTCKRSLPFLWAASAVGMAVTLRLTWMEFHKEWQLYIQTYHNLFAGVFAATVFVTVRCLYARVEQQSRLGRATAALGSCVLGVYLLHVPLMDHTRFFQELVWMPMDALGLPQLVCGLLYTLIMFVCLIPAAAALRRIPGIRRLLS